MIVSCPHCHHSHAVPDALSGRVTDCPACHRRFIAKGAQPRQHLQSGRTGAGLGMTLFLLVLTVALATLGYVCWNQKESPLQLGREWLARFHPQPQPAAPPAAEPAPGQTAPLPPPPPPAVTPAEPAPAAPPESPPTPAVTSAPAPTPVVDPLAWLLADQSRRPSEIALTIPVRFLLKNGDDVLGSVLLPVGSRVQLLQIKDDRVSVSYRGNTRTIPMDATDLLQSTRMEINRRNALFQLAASNAAASAAPAPRPSGLNAPFIHPGGLHTKADLDRMKAKVASGLSPWIECWEKLVQDPLSQSGYRAHATPNLGDNDGGAGRQRASRDAHAAYLNFIRWYISGDREHAECAIRICNDWSAAVNRQPSGHDIPGLSGIPISEFAMAGELLRSCPLWKKDDQERFKNMMRTWFYPHVKAYLDFKNRTGSSAAWANWDICNIQALLAMGVLLDDRTIFDEGVEYFKNGRGTGSIRNAVYFMHPGGLGQWQESGRDQGHAQLGVGMLGQACQIAWNQGVDLFGCDDNRLLAGAEYVAATALWVDLPFKFYNNQSNSKNYWIAYNNGGGRLNSPVWELLYNHYVVLQGLKAPYTGTMAALTRPEGGGGDHFGYGTLTFTLDAAASPYPPLPKPAAPLGLIASPGVGRVYLSWQVPAAHDVNGYTIRRATSAGGPFTEIASWTRNTGTRYTDTNVDNGTSYYYDVAALNQSGASPASAKAGATPVAPGPLPAGWSCQTVGPATGPAASARYADAGHGTCIVKGIGSGIGGESDSFGYAFRKCPGDFTLTARLADTHWTGGHNRVGLMVRETLQPGAKAAYLTLGDIGARQSRFGVRASTGGHATEQGGNDYTWLPVWFRLQRSGTAFTASESADGETWFVVGSEKMPVTGSCYVGLAVSADNPDDPNTTTFDHITVANSSTPP